MSDGITITFEMNLKPGLGDVVAARLPAMIDETATRPGFRDLRAVRHRDDPDRVLLIESWESEEAYDAYIAWRAERGETMDKGFTTPPVVNVWPDTIVRR